MDGSLNWQRHSITSLAHRYLSKVWKKELKHVELFWRKKFDKENHLRIAKKSNVCQIYKHLYLLYIYFYWIFWEFNVNMHNKVHNNPFASILWLTTSFRILSLHRVSSAFFCNWKYKYFHQSQNLKEKKLIAGTSTEQVSDDSQKINCILFLLTYWESNHFNKSMEFW